MKRAAKAKPSPKSPAIPMQDFCGDLRRYRRPFVMGGFLWATDARVLVRVPSDGPDSTPDEGITFPNAPAIFNSSFQEAGRFVPLRNREFEMEMCLDCCGEPLPPCGACGCHPACKQCGGSGSVVSDRNVRLGAALVSPKYWRLLASLPGCQVVLPKKGQGDDPISVRFDGGQGLWMPCSRNT